MVDIWTIIRPWYQTCPVCSLSIVSVVYNIAACYRSYNPNKILPRGRSLSIHKIADSSYLFS